MGVAGLKIARAISAVGHIRHDLQGIGPMSSFRCLRRGAELGFVIRHECRERYGPPIGRPGKLLRRINQFGRRSRLPTRHPSHVEPRRLLARAGDIGEPCAIGRPGES